MKYRIDAALMHLVISALTFFTISFLMIYYAYPPNYFSASGGWQGLKIVACIDLVLGPLLTLIVVSKNKVKSKLIFDVIFIAFLQLSALFYGLFTIYQQRPVANVFWEWENLFFVVTADDLNKQNFDISNLREFGDARPVAIVATKPKTVQDINSVRDKAAQQAIPPYLQTNLYRPLSSNFSEIKGKQVDLTKLYDSEKITQEKLIKLVSIYGGKPEDYIVFSLQAKYQLLGLVFTIQGEYLTTILLRDN